MSNERTFSILSTKATLVEVIGNGPISDVANGLTIPDGAAITAPLDLHRAPVRRWRVDAPHNVSTAVVVTDSPYGAFVDVRRRVAAVESPKWWQPLAAERWPTLRGVLKRRLPSLVALWYLFTDSDPPPFTWQGVNDGASNQAQARGGDLVVVNFVTT